MSHHHCVSLEQNCHYLSKWAAHGENIKRVQLQMFGGFLKLKSAFWCLCETEQYSGCLSVQSPVFSFRLQEFGKRFIQASFLGIGFFFPFSFSIITCDKCTRSNHNFIIHLKKCFLFFFSYFEKGLVTLCSMMFLYFMSLFEVLSQDVDS